MFLFLKQHGVLFVLMALTLILGCKKTNPSTPSKPLLIVTTTAASYVTAVGAITGGTVATTGDTTITDKGVCYGTSPNPTITNNIVSSGKGANAFSSEIADLQPNTTYYVRAYATDSNGTGYGNQQSFKTQQIDSAVTIYVANGSATLYSFNASNGVLKWQIGLPANGYVPVYANGLIYIGCGNNRLYAYDTTGNLKWSVQITGNLGANIIVQNNMLLIEYTSNNGTDNATFSALNAQTGSPIWQYSFAGLGNSFMGSAIDDNSLYLTFYSNIFSLNLQTGTVNWSVNENQPTSSAPFILNNKLYIIKPGSTTSLGGLYVFDKNSGTQLWTTNWNQNLFFDPSGGSIIGGTVTYKYNTLYCFIGGTMIATDTTSGQINFTATTLGGNNKVIDNYTVYSPTGSDDIYTYDALTGAFKQDFTSYRMLGGSRIIFANGLLYYATVNDDFGVNGSLFNVGHVFCKDATTGSTKWISTVYDVFNGSIPCVVTQSGKSYYLGVL